VLQYQIYKSIISGAKYVVEQLLFHNVFGTTINFTILSYSMHAFRRTFILLFSATR